MCGIVGTVQFGDRRRYELDDVRRMAGTIVHRGPNDEGMHDGGAAILGMRRLSIIDLAGGHQPISNEDGTVWVVCNGEIYNFREIRKSLQQRGHRFSTGSDTEVLVHLYEEYGENLLSHIDGMFGFALWDQVNKKFILARDRMGMKPVYYWPFQSGLAFSSEIKAFRALPGFSSAMDPAALRDHVVVGYAVASRTIFSGVSKLAPASALIWQDGRYEISRYWTPPRSVDRSRSSRDWVDLVRAELDRVVAEHLVSDVPLGAFLSGGVDSSVVAALMAKHSQGSLNTYSIGYRGSAVADYYNELPYARLVANQLGSNHREIEVQPDVSRLLPKLLWHLEEPISDSAITTTYLVSQLAAESVTVILSGVGGDELFAGYKRYLGPQYNRQYSKVPAIIRQLLPAVAKILPSGRQNKIMDFGRYAKRFLRGHELDWRQQYKLYMQLADPEVLDSLQSGAGSSQNGFDTVLASEDADDELLRFLRVDWQTQLSEDLLLLTDKMTMACSLECRVPFLDHRLVEAVATIPASYKLPGGRLKGLLKEAVRGWVPDSVIDRGKRGFGMPMGTWLKRELMPLRRHLLSRETIASRGLLDPAAVEALCTSHDANKEDYTDLLLVLINLEIWNRLFVDGRSHEDVTTELLERSLAA